jgi:hypothetical protein
LFSGNDIMTKRIKDVSKFRDAIGAMQVESVAITLRHACERGLQLADELTPKQQKRHKKEATG